jgi:uncharacterized protein (TIGR02246 family)
MMTTSAKVRGAIEAADGKFMTRFSQGDAAGVAALYTESGQLMPPNSDVVTGKPAIQATIQAFLDMGVKAIKLNTVETEDYGETASEVGRYTLEAEGGQVIDKGKYIVLWKQDAGEWKLHRDIFNTSMPAPE